MWNESCVKYTASYLYNTAATNYNTVTAAAAHTHSLLRLDRSQVRRIFIINSCFEFWWRRRCIRCIHIIWINEDIKHSYTIRRTVLILKKKLKSIYLLFHESQIIFFFNVGDFSLTNYICFRLQNYRYLITKLICDGHCTHESI